MTAQFSEIILIDGTEHSLCTEPLEYYFGLAGKRPNFDFNCTALYRGYVGTWQVVHDRLYLVGIRGEIFHQEDGTTSQVTLNSLFPGYPERVFAHWFTGELRIPQGKLLEYHHGGFNSEYERDWFMTVEQGVVLAQRIKVNGIAPSDAPDGVVVSAATYF